MTSRLEGKNEYFFLFPPPLLPPQQNENVQTWVGMHYDHHGKTTLTSSHNILIIFVENMVSVILVTNTHLDVYSSV